MPDWTVVGVPVDCSARQRGEELALHVVISRGIKRAWLFQKIEVAQHHVAFLPDIVLGCRKPLRQGLTLHLQLAYALAYLFRAQ